MSYNEPTCKGSILLGTACGKCPKCKDELGKIHKQLGSDPEPNVESPPGLVGWTCPRCGAGNAPRTSRCACVPMPPITITC